MRLFSDQKYLPKMYFGTSDLGRRVKADTLSAIPDDAGPLYQTIAEMPTNAASLEGRCGRCDSGLTFPPNWIWRMAKCPACGGTTRLDNKEFSELVIKYVEAKYAESLRKVTCPNCGVPYEYDVCQPSKPIVFTPLSFTGILMGGIANAMADHIFPEINICRLCGHRWPHEE